MIAPAEIPIPPRRNAELTPKVDRAARYFEPVLIFLCFAAYAGQLPPDVNESHYLTKAKYFWDPNWCAGDIFLGSSFSHWLFYVSAGWLTKFFSLSVVAWIGRCLTWALLAFAWRRLSWNLFQTRWIAVISAIFFLLLNDHFHLAGEWVVGGLEAKGFAYFFVLMALGSIVHRDWAWAWPFLGVAAAFHVLVGGWAILASMFAWFILVYAQDSLSHPIQKQIKRQAVPFLIAFAFAMVGAIPPLLAERNVDPEIAIQARNIYVNHRIAHHLSFDAFPSLNVARFVAMVGVWMLLGRWLAFHWSAFFRRVRPLSSFCIGSLIISFGGLLLSGLAEQDGQLAVMSQGMLRFYWFRLADFAFPMATSLACCGVLCCLLRPNLENKTAKRLSCGVFIACIVLAAGLEVVEKHSDQRPRADRRSLPTYFEDAVRTTDTYHNWLKVCQWIATNTPEDSTFITPHEQQTFKWYAGRAEVVCWKDVPQDAAGILDWNRRLIELYEPQRRYESGLMSYSDEQILGFAKHYGANYLLVPQRHVDIAAAAAEPTKLKQVYPESSQTKSTYVVFDLSESIK